jgi:hypothetical protein
METLPPVIAYNGAPDRCRIDAERFSFRIPENAECIRFFRNYIQ